MNDRHVRGFGRRWANHGLQARPGFVGLFVLRPRPGLAEPPRSFRSSNPEGWQRVARGRSGAETPGKQSGDPCILKGCQNCATPPGVVAQLRLRSGGIAALNHRTIWQAFGLRRQRDEGELSQQWMGRYHLGLPGPTRIQELQYFPVRATPNGRALPTFMRMVTTGEAWLPINRPITEQEGIPSLACLITRTLKSAVFGIATSRRIWNSLTHSDNDQGDIGTWYAEPFHCSESGVDAGMSCCGPVSPVR